MSDARSLLKAKRAERGVAPKARAGPAARINLKVDAAETQASRKGKRKLDNGGVELPDVRPAAPAAHEPSPPHDKRRRIEDTSGGFPSDFFSDASRSLPIAGDDDSDDEEPEGPSTSNPSNFTQTSSSTNPPSTSTLKASGAPAAPNSNIDDEFAAFERAIQAASKATAKQDANLAAYAKATVSAEPELIDEDTIARSGFPPPELSKQEQERRQQEAEEQNAIDEQRRKEEEERELIMDRLVEEERAQEDADAKVTALKARLEAIRLKRAAKKAGAS
ncbi:hypothetical protein DL93DRAFT_2093294 [Clavulina sp. PMI_390]|nr:hypothetical protein DL93DRAFT_2093294 [Clavulina sp. PMI_390]